MEPTHPVPDRTGGNPPDANGVVGGAGQDLRIGVIRNPRSHRNRLVRDDLSAFPEAILVEPKSKDGLGEELGRLNEAGVDVLVIDGGDGTVRDVLTRGHAIFGNRWPHLLVLPKGKTNALAIDLGMPGSLVLEQALRGMVGARRELRRPLLLECLADKRAPVLGFIMGTGVFSTAIDAGQVAHRFGAFQGLAVALTTGMGVLQALFGFGQTPWRAVTRHDIRVGETRSVLVNRFDPEEGRRFAAGFSTLSAFPIGLKPFAGEPGPIRYVVFDKPLRRTMALAPAILMGMDKPLLERLGVHRGSAECIELDLGGRFILDGEAFPPGPWRVSLGPQLTFLVP